MPVWATLSLSRSLTNTEVCAEAARYGVRDERGEKGDVETLFRRWDRVA